MSSSTIERSSAIQRSGGGSIPDTMMAAVVHEFERALVIEERPVPVPGPGALLAEVAACVTGWETLMVLDFAAAEA